MLRQRWRHWWRCCWSPGWFSCFFMVNWSNWWDIYLWYNQTFRWSEYIMATLNVSFSVTLVVLSGLSH
jgi:hypothetical protein